MAERKTTEQFIKDAVKVHGDKYDYSLSEYFNCEEKIIIICKIHGEFNQLSYNHVKGQGCPKCKSDKMKEINSDTKDTFIKKAVGTHGDKYDYSNVIYNSSKTKIDIICKQHGMFSQSPSKHIYGRGCPKCGSIKLSKSLSSNTEDFIIKAKKIHNDKYIYDKVQYINNTSDITITCKLHGNFTQRPANHLNGANCYRCGKDKAAISRTKSLEEVLKEAVEIHNNKYDYSNVNYTNCKNKVDIICKQHGTFKQTMDSHLSGSGCNECSKEQDYYRRSNYIKLAKYSILYLVRFWSENEEFYKIGKSIYGAKKRLSKRVPYEFDICKEYKTEIEKVYDLEIELHRKYKYYKYRPFEKFIGCTECYTIELPIQEIINLGCQKE